jgi:hypothetical protein
MFATSAFGRDGMDSFIESVPQEPGKHHPKQEQQTKSQAEAHQLRERVRIGQDAIGKIAGKRDDSREQQQAGQD